MSKRLRARVTYVWGGWWYRLQADPGFIEYSHPVSFPTAAMAADAARRELDLRTEPDPLVRILRRLGMHVPRYKSEFVLVN